MAEQGDLLSGAVATAEADGAGNQGAQGSGGTPGTSLATDGSPPAFHGQFKDHLKGHASLMKFENPSDLAEAYVNLEALQGRSVEIPGEKATDEDRSRFNALLRGNVKTPEEYDFNGAKLPEGVTLSEVGVTELRKMAYDNGWTNAQAINAIEWDARRQQDAVQQVQQVMQQSRRDAELELRRDWGNEYDQNILLAQRVVERHGDEGLRTVLKETGLGNHPALVKMLSKIGSSISEDAAPRGESGKPTADMSAFPAAQAAAERYRKSGAGV